MTTVTDHSKKITKVLLVPFGSCGRYVLIVCAISLALYIFLQWNIMLLVLIFLSQILLLSGLGYLLSQPVDVAVTSPPTSVTVGQIAEIEFSLRPKVPTRTKRSIARTNQIRRLPLLQMNYLEMEVTNLNTNSCSKSQIQIKQTTSQRVQLPTVHRSQLLIGSVTIVQTDWFNIFERRKVVYPTFTLFICPPTKQLSISKMGKVQVPNGVSAFELINSGFDFSDIREYVAGDTPKTIHWKMSAKYGGNPADYPAKLYTKQFHQTRNGQILILIDNVKDSYTIDVEFELAVTLFNSLIVSYLSGSTVRNMNNKTTDKSFGKSVSSLYRKMNNLLHIGATTSLTKSTCLTCVQPTSQQILQNFICSLQLIDGQTVQIRSQISNLLTQHQQVDKCIYITGSKVELTYTLKLLSSLTRAKEVLVVQADPLCQTSVVVANQIVVAKVSCLEDLVSLASRLLFNKFCQNSAY